jgi:hypothetical protein
VYLQTAINICTRHQATSISTTNTTNTAAASAGTGSSSSRARANSAGSSSSISSSSAMSQSDAAKLFDKFQPLFAESINQFYKVSICTTSVYTFVYTYSAVQHYFEYTLNCDMLSSSVLFVPNLCTPDPSCNGCSSQCYAVDQCLLILL